MCAGNCSDAKLNRMLLAKDAFGRLCRARDLLREFGDKPVTIHEVARQAGMSPFHFIRRFEALFGLTPHQFRIACRMDRARVLLAAGQHSVTEVCMEVGMSSLGSFTDLFVRRIGTTPSDFRRRARVVVPVRGFLAQTLFPGCFSLLGRLPAAAFRNFREARSRDVQLTSVENYNGGRNANQTNFIDGQ
jgi:AraC-like DNA-binding protein